MTLAADSGRLGAAGLRTLVHQGASGVANEHLLGDDREYSSSSLSIESSLRYDSTGLVVSN